MRAFAALPSYEGRSPARMWLVAMRGGSPRITSSTAAPSKVKQTEDWASVAEFAGAREQESRRVVVLRR